MNKFAIQTRESKLQNMAWKQRNTAQNLFPKECKAIIYLVNVNAKKNLGSRKQSMRVMQNTEFFYIHQIGLT